MEKYVIGFKETSNKNLEIPKWLAWKKACCYIVLSLGDALIFIGFCWSSIMFSPPPISVIWSFWGEREEQCSYCGWVCMCGCISRCTWVAFLGTVLGQTICLYGVDKMVVNAAGFCIARERFRWSYCRKCGVIGSFVPILIDDGYT